MSWWPQPRGTSGLHSAVATGPPTGAGRGASAKGAHDLADCRSGGWGGAFKDLDEVALQQPEMWMGREQLDGLVV
jgi:hypothetical protein